MRRGGGLAGNRVGAADGGQRHRRGSRDGEEKRDGGFWSG